MPSTYGSKDHPFFLYLPHTAMHVPLYPHQDFVGRSKNGTYGDWVEEVDWSVGQVLDALQDCRETGLVLPGVGKQFGHGEVKATCLWLRNLPKLRATQVVAGREARVHLMPPGPDRWKERSRTFEGVADAMGDQWGGRELPAVAEQLQLI